MNRLVSSLALISTLCGIYAGVANAAVLEVQAEIRPDPSNPGNAEIVNNTPISGYCAEFPAQCTGSGRNIRSNSFNINFQSSGMIPKDHVLPFGFPATWRKFTVAHTSIPGETAEVQIRIAGVGTRYRLSRTAQQIIGHPLELPVFDYHALLWAPSWANAIAPCQTVNASSQGADSNGTDFTAFWLTPENVSTCSRRPGFDIPGLTLQRLDVHYEMRAVRPAELISGNYQGTYTYSVGGDFDMGSLVASDGSITFNLNLAVKQDVKVEMSADRIHLAPKGGWMEWVNHGRKTEKLLGDLRFFMLTTSPFKMELGCERLGVNTCEITNGSHQVPVDISVSLARPWVDGAGQPVTRRPLTLSGDGTKEFKLTDSLTRAPSILHFEVAQDSVKGMASDSSYRGTVYVTFDSDI